jgi:uncharacterized membrane protein
MSTDIQKDSTTEQETRDAKLTLLYRETFSAPFPPPDMLRQYDEIQPGLVERIFAYAEKDQEHFHFVQREKISVEKRKVSDMFWTHTITNICITILFLSLISVGTFSLYLGYNKTAIVIFTVPVIRLGIAMTRMIRNELSKDKTD